jgi:hypothetical protein
MKIKITILTLIAFHSAHIIGSDEQTPLTQRGSRLCTISNNCMCGLYVACPIVLGFGGYAAGGACFWEAPHSCSNFPIPSTQSTTDEWSRLTINSYLGPVIWGIAGAAVGGAIDGIAYGLCALHNRYSAPKQENPV